MVVVAGRVEFDRRRLSGTGIHWTPAPRSPRDCQCDPVCCARALLGETWAANFGAVITLAFI